MKVLHQKFSVPFEYDVLFTKHLFDIENKVFLETIRKHTQNFPVKVYFIIDDQVARHHPALTDQIKQYFQAYGTHLQLCASPLLVPGGEACKNDPKYVEEILKAVNNLAIDRQSYIVAIGGGAVLDMTGYASSIAHRGIRHIRIPTTVLAQNDAGIGVKNAINYFDKKNFLGCFTPPVAVINDNTFLTTLEERDWRAGISEAIKVALIKEASFFNFLEDHVRAFLSREEAPMDKLIYECARLHLEHIASGDPFELGSSRPLDFGHWAAHKLEQLTNYRLRHGEAVAIGMALDVTYSKLEGRLTASAHQRIINLIKNLQFDLFVPELLEQDEDEYLLLRGLHEFREHLGGKLTIMLLEDIGKGVEVHELDENLILQSIREIQKMQTSLV